MFSKKYYPPKRINSALLISDRQFGNIDSLINSRLQSSTIEKIELEATLEGHNGCVNCLEWNKDGRILASGSDDLCVILWDVFRHKQLYNFRTPHTGNMFSVKFLPNSNDNLIATCAADKCIYVFDLNRNNEPIWNCKCHLSRVKRLATAPDTPFTFWSAGEDGNILQFDIREPHRCQPQDKVLLINLTQHILSHIEAKCISVNPRRTEYIAIGANDQYARLYDRRMLKLENIELSGRRQNGTERPAANSDNNLPQNCVQYFCPGQYYNNNPKHIGRDTKAITYLTFNSNGNELLVNMGAEHIYLYDINHAEKPIFLKLPDYPIPNTDDVLLNNSDEILPNSVKKKLPDNVECFKKMGNDFLENEKYLRAIEQYSEAIEMAPYCPILYLNRATALMRRMWYGDVYAAIRDCHKALNLDPSYIKAHFRLARALLDLGKIKEADECLTELIIRFPTYETNHGVMMLKKDIAEHKKTEEILNGITTNDTNTNNTTATATPIATLNLNNNGSIGTLFDDFEMLDFEWNCRLMAKDYYQRFIGHCNTTTDIKEATYFGDNNIVAGSDDGNFFIWERQTNKIASIYKGDMAIVNCIQPHPSICMLATSGIDHEVKIWSPLNIDRVDEKSNRVQYIDGIVETNQHKMKTDPFDLNPSSSFCRSS